MTEECRPRLRRVPGWEVCRLGRFTGYRFRRDGRGCLLVQSGMGLKRAGDASRARLAAASLQVLVSFGVAGAVKDAGTGWLCLPGFVGQDTSKFFLET